MSIDTFKVQVSQTPKIFSSDYIELNSYKKLFYTSNTKDKCILNTNDSKICYLTIVEIKCAKTHILQITLASNLNVTQLKSTIASQLDLNLNDKRLIMQGKVLTNDELIDTETIKHSTIYLL